MASKDEIKNSMDARLWMYAWDHLANLDPFKRSRTIPTGIRQATRDLAKLYLEANRVSSLDQLYKLAKNKQWEDVVNRPGVAGKWNFGSWLVMKAIGGRTDWMNVPRMDGFKIPFFDFKFDGEYMEWEGSDDHLRPNPSSKTTHAHGKHGTRSLAEVREILAGRGSHKCDPKCAGWSVFMTDDVGHAPYEIQVCDDCNSELPKSVRLTDMDVEQLPEAQLELAKMMEQVDDEGAAFEANPKRRRNPSGADDVDEMIGNPAAYTRVPIESIKLPDGFEDGEQLYIRRLGTYELVQIAGDGKYPNTLNYTILEGAMRGRMGTGAVFFRKATGNPAYAGPQFFVGQEVIVDGHRGRVEYVPYPGGADGNDDRRLDKVQVGSGHGGARWYPVSKVKAAFR